jgi:type II secretory pathway pseudopilin PulG
MRGFTYLGVLIAVALMGVALLAVSEVWVTTANRQKMEQLEWAGNQYAQAIGSYYYANVGSVRYYPQTFDDLLRDRRYLGIKRHLRERYVNPFTGQSDWQVIVAPGGGIRGVQVAVELPAGW